MTVHPDSPLESNIEAQRFTGIELGRGKEQGRWPLKMPTSVCGRGRERERERGILYMTANQTESLEPEWERMKSFELQSEVRVPVPAPCHPGFLWFCFIMCKRRQQCLAHMLAEPWYSLGHRAIETSTAPSPRHLFLLRHSPFPHYHILHSQSACGQKIVKLRTEKLRKYLPIFSHLFPCRWPQEVCHIFTFSFFVVQSI